MPSPSVRAANAIASSIRRFVPLIVKAKAEGTRVIELHIGDPDLDAPQPVLDAIRGYDRKTIPYAPATGVPELLAAWQSYYARYGVTVDAANIIPTAGCAEAIVLSMMAVADVGDDILCFEPLYVGFKSTAHNVGVRLVPVTLDIAANLALPSAAEIEAKLTPNTKAIVIINPDNPTGKVWTREEAERVLDLARKHDLFVIVDETYREFVFDGTPWTALALPAHRDRVVVIDSCSKRFSAPGTRVGCVVSHNAELMTGVRKFAMSRLSAAYVEQFAVIPMLRNPEPYVSQAVATYKERRDAAVAALSAVPGVVCGRPDGAFYVVARLPISDADAFVEFMLSTFRQDGETVSLTPLPDFYATPGAGRNEIRIALVRPPEDIRRGIALLAAGLAAFQARQ